jgi:tetratricopeptide (TPR) repeat protein
MTKRMLLAALLMVGTAGVGCGKRAVVEQSSSSDFDTEARGEGSVSTSLRLTGDPKELMAAAGRAEMDGDFDAAIAAYERLLDTSGVEEEVREEALYRLGMAYGDPRNGNRNYEAAIRELTRFLEAYPESKYAEPAAASRDKYRDLLER